MQQNLCTFRIYLKSSCVALTQYDHQKCWTATEWHTWLMTNMSWNVRTSEDWQIFRFWSDCLTDDWPETSVSLFREETIDSSVDLFPLLSPANNEFMHQPVPLFRVSVYGLKRQGIKPWTHDTQGKGLADYPMTMPRVMSKHLSLLQQNKPRCPLET